MCFHSQFVKHLGKACITFQAAAHATISTFCFLFLITACGAENQDVEVGDPLSDLSRRDFGADHSAGCLTSGCHQRLASKRWVHGPIAVQACAHCHLETSATLKDHSFQTEENGRELCLSCHPDEAGDEFLHEPYADGRCLDCHDPHGGGRKNFLLKQTVQELCKSCHQDQMVSVSHEPRDSGDCLSCHRSHSSRHAHLLLRQETELCTACHREFRPFLAENLLTSGVIAHAHPAVLSDGCLGCHQAHGSEHPSMLKNELQETCVRCHQDLHVGIQDAEVMHVPFEGEQSCVRCHTPHASVFDGLLRERPADVCFQCHAEKVETKSGKVLANISQKVESSSVVHHPVAEGDCTACHVAHFSQQRSLLRLKYPQKIYREFSGGSYELCFQCHDRKLVKENGHRYTAFRNGAQNLHYVHVHQEKGRACDICHDPHASDQHRLVRKTYPFGPSRWPLPLGFTATADGGSCTSACHEELGYTR
jgi:predicted CXXCH cytochrome family protein